MAKKITSKTTVRNGVSNAKQAVVPDLTKYKDAKFDWAINTKYFCHKESNCSTCKEICFNIYKNGTCKDNLIEISDKLDYFRGWNWRDIERSNNGTSCGVMQIKDLDVREMIHRHFEAINIDDDVLYKIEIAGRHRVWGIRRESVFYLIWSDEEHRFYKHHETNYTKPRQS